MSLHESILRLCAAGPIASIARVGHAPFDTDDPIELTFASGAVFHVDIGFEGATDIIVGDGPLLEQAFGHLRRQEPATFEAIARDWTREAIDLPWAIGQSLQAPRRLTMTLPYRIEVGYVFACGGRELALVGESDLLFAAALEDPEIKSFQLEVAD